MIAYFIFGALLGGIIGYVVAAFMHLAAKGDEELKDE